MVAADAEGFTNPLGRLRRRLGIQSLRGVVGPADQLQPHPQLIIPRILLAAAHQLAPPFVLLKTPANVIGVYRARILRVNRKGTDAPAIRPKARPFVDSRPERFRALP